MRKFNEIVYYFREFKMFSSKIFCLDNENKKKYSGKHFDYSKL